MTFRKLKFFILFLGLSVLLTAQHGFAQMTDEQRAAFEEIKINEVLGTPVSIENLEFKDETGRTVKLAEYFDGKNPVIISLIYFGCPSLCGFLLNGMTEALQKLDWNVGDQFKVLTVSIDPSEDSDLAAAKKKSYLEQYGREGAEENWHFLTGSEDQVQQLAKELGFGYKWVEDTQEYAHSAGIFILTPQGVLSRVLHGIEFDPKDLKLSMLEASNGKIGTLSEKILMFCFRYDPEAKGYSLHAFRLVQTGAGIFVIFLAVYLFVFWRREMRKPKANDTK
ncbi:MAG: SCO family protein [Bdellovibrionota bacterium]|jgi:protein SCO1/2